MWDRTKETLDPLFLFSLTSLCAVQIALVKDAFYPMLLSLYGPGPGTESVGEAVVHCGSAAAHHL